MFGFVRQSGGDISIDSKPGRGTTVRIYLPAAAGDVPAITVPAADEPGWGVQVDPPSGPAAETAKEIVLHPVAAAPGQPRGERVPVTSRKPDVALPVWHRAENAVFASVADPTSQGHYRLIVEPIPGEDGWDWTVWRPGSNGQQARHGRASSVVGAMAAAESAAEHWRKTSLRDDRSDLSDKAP